MATSGSRVQPHRWPETLPALPGAEDCSSDAHRHLPGREMHREQVWVSDSQGLGPGRDRGGLGLTAANNRAAGRLHAISRFSPVPESEGLIISKSQLESTALHRWDDSTHAKGSSPALKPVTPYFSCRTWCPDSFQASQHGQKRSKSSTSARLKSQRSVGLHLIQHQSVIDQFSESDKHKQQKVLICHMIPAETREPRLAAGSQALVLNHDIRTLVGINSDDRQQQTISLRRGLSCLSDAANKCQRGATAAKAQFLPMAVIK